MKSKGKKVEMPTHKELLEKAKKFVATITNEKLDKAMRRQTNVK